MKLIFRTTLALILVFGAASITATAQDDRNKIETYIGYSYLSTDAGLSEVDTNLEDRVGTNGVELSITGNPHRYIGIKGDFSWHQKTDNFVNGADNASLRYRTGQFLGGVQFKDNKLDGSHLRPFAHVLVGLAHQSVTVRGTLDSDPFDEDFTSNNFAMAFGGGLDVRINNRVSLRVIQAEYNPIFFRSRDINGISFEGRTQSNFRIGAGVVFH